MIHYLLLCLLSFLPQKEVELSINKYVLEENVLTLHYCIRNNTNEYRLALLSLGFSTIPYYSSLSFLIIENDTILLHEENPTLGFSSRTIYTTISPRDSICKVIKVNMSELYTSEELSSSRKPHQIKGKCSFQLIYYDRFLDNGKVKFATSIEERIKQKNLKPITDTLYSNIIYINKR